MWRTLRFESPPVQSYCGGPGATLPPNTQHSLCRTPCELRPVETAAGHACKCCKHGLKALCLLSSHYPCVTSLPVTSSTFIQSYAKWMDFIEWDLLLLFSLPLVSSPEERVYVFVCFPEQKQTPPHTPHFPAASLFLSEAISEHIDASSSCAAEILLNTDPKPQVTSPNPAH